MTAQTPYYGIKYLSDGQPMRDTAVVLQQNAETIEAAMLAGPTPGPAGQGFTFRGAWAAGTAYHPYDVVTYAGQTWEASTSFTAGTSFNAANWNLWAAKGDTGAAGTAGAAGQGVPTGGSTGQALVKNSATNYDTGWATISSGGGGANPTTVGPAANGWYMSLPDTAKSFAGSATASTVYYTPVVLPAGTLSAVGLLTGNNTTTATAVVGLYTVHATTRQPQTLLGSASGSIGGAAFGFYSITLTVTVPSTAVYFLAVTTSATLTLGGAPSNNGGLYLAPVGLGVNPSASPTDNTVMNGYSGSAAAGPALPTTPGAALTANPMPRPWFKMSAVS